MIYHFKSVKIYIVSYHSVQRTRKRNAGLQFLPQSRRNYKERKRESNRWWERNRKSRRYRERNREGSRFRERKGEKRRDKDRAR